MDIDLNIKERIEQYYQAIQEIPEKSLKRIILVEKIINEVEVENNTLLNKIKGNELTISFFARDKKLGITRKSIYSDKYLLEYLNFKISEKQDYMNLKKIDYLNEKYAMLEEDYNKILDNMINRFDIKMQVETYKDTIEALVEENKQLDELVKEKQETINNLNNDLKSYKIIELK
ncbi:MAG: hypothetical protein ACRCYE_12405 [Sarcina sp.]